MANTQAFYSASITPVKSFIGQAPGANPIKLFTALIYGFRLAGKGLLGTNALAYFENS